MPGQIALNGPPHELLAVTVTVLAALGHEPVNSRQGVRFKRNNQAHQPDKVYGIPAHPVPLLHRAR